MFPFDDVIMTAWKSNITIHHAFCEKNHMKTPLHFYSDESHAMQMLHFGWKKCQTSFHIQTQNGILLSEQRPSNDNTLVASDTTWSENVLVHVYIDQSAKTLLLPREKFKDMVNLKSCPNAMHFPLRDNWGFRHREIQICVSLNCGDNYYISGVTSVICYKRHFSTRLIWRLRWAVSVIEKIIIITTLCFCQHIYPDYNLTFFQLGYTHIVAECTAEILRCVIIWTNMATGVIYISSAFYWRKYIYIWFIRIKTLPPNQQQIKFSLINGLVLNRQHTTVIMGIHPGTYIKRTWNFLGPLLLTWFNFNPSMDK